MNTGQFKTVLRDQFLSWPLTKTSGQPFQIAELEEAIRHFDGVEGNEGGGAVNDQHLRGPMAENA